MKVLHAILVARYPERPAGHWVVMKTTIAGVDLFVMAYAWSQKGVAYFVSTAGKTIRHSTNYISRFEDEYGNVHEKQLPWPTIAHLLYEFLPLIDEHNKARQHALALEKCWLSKDCWFRVMTTFVGMAVVDEQRFDRNKRSGSEDGVTSLARQEEVGDDFDIRVMANLICKPLATGQFKFRETAQPTARANAYNGNANKADPLIRITAADGTKNYERKEGQEDTKLKPRQRTCFICRRYRPDGVNTQWQCGDCGMALCKRDRGREVSCLTEHKQSANHILGCGYLKRRPHQFVMPKEMKLYKCTRSVTAAIEKNNQSKRKGNGGAARVSPEKRSRHR